MSNFAEEPLTKVTLNLYTKDIEFLKEIATDSYTKLIRKIIRDEVNAIKENDRE